MDADRGNWPDGPWHPQGLGGGQSSGPALSPQHMVFRKQQDLDNILKWQPSEVSPMQRHLGRLCPPSPHTHPAT